MAVTISGVEPDSIAARHGISPGDTLLRIGGQEIEDVLDYRFHMTARGLLLELTDRAGTLYTREIRKGEYEDLGLEFGTYLMDRQRPCRNKCIFCFIDQLPKGLRDSLYFKDDDSRMSFLFGNYVTLTNLRERDIERILAMRLSPLNISVHTTNPDLRVRMMANPRAGEVLGWLDRLAGAGISINAQLVLCPGVNDGEELERSLGDLCRLAPQMQSVAVVPVGLTRFRDGLTPLRLFTPDESRAVIETADRFGGEMARLHGTRICYPADEFFLSAGLPFPLYDYYEEFAQLENGVGLLPLLIDEFEQALGDAAPRAVSRRVTIATGVAAHPSIAGMARAAMERFPGLSVEAVPIRNDFFGHTITVAGLVTGSDLLAQLVGRDLGDALLIPAAMLRHERDLFLDSVSVETLGETLGVPVRIVENSGEDLLSAMTGG